MKTFNYLLLIPLFIVFSLLLTQTSWSQEGISFGKPSVENNPAHMDSDEQLKYKKLIENHELDFLKDVPPEDLLFYENQLTLEALEEFDKDGVTIIGGGALALMDYFRERFIDDPERLELIEQAVNEDGPPSGIIVYSERLGIGHILNKCSRWTHWPPWECTESSPYFLCLLSLGSCEWHWTGCRCIGWF